MRLPLFAGAALVGHSPAAFAASARRTVARAAVLVKVAGIERE